jgi:hypothetical protein
MTTRLLQARSTARRFGRGRPFVLAAPMESAHRGLADELQLFATWFLGGFVFTSVFLA